jgi:RimJ/RimL family protein N-acetyltransferase
MNDRSFESLQLAGVKNPEILIDIPERLESERLILRCPQPGDGAIYHDFATECFDDTKKWFGPWAKESLNLSQCEELVRKMHCEFIQRSELNYLVFQKGSEQIIGRAFISKLDWKIPKGMLGYWTRLGRQKEGLGHEVVLTLRRFVFDTLHFKRLEGWIDPENLASQKLAEKCGFKFEGRLRNFSHDNFGVLHDFLSYSIIPSDLDSQ